MTDSLKIIHSLLYIANRQNSKTICSRKAYKLLWLADRLHLRKYGRSITGDVYYALPKGIVPSDAKHIIDNEPTVWHHNNSCDVWFDTSRRGFFKALKDYDQNVFSESDIEILDFVINEFGKESADSLTRISHSYPEWLTYKSDLINRNKPNAYQVDMNLFFENNDSAECKHIFDQSETQLKLTKEIFNGIL